MTIKMTHEQRMVQSIHNGHIGRLRMSLACMRAIRDSKTITEDARAHVKIIVELIEQLPVMLDNRVNADGTTTVVKWNKLTVDDGLFRS